MPETMAVKARSKIAALANPYPRASSSAFSQTELASLKSPKTPRGGFGARCHCRCIDLAACHPFSAFDFQ